MRFNVIMSSEFPDKRGHIYTKTITLKCEPELWSAFEQLKIETKKDVPECQRIALRELLERLRKTG